jgi:membrane-bound ClpP family serine protease
LLAAKRFGLEQSWFSTVSIFILQTKICTRRIIWIKMMIVMITPQNKEGSRKYRRTLDKLSNT